MTTSILHALGTRVSAPALSLLVALLACVILNSAIVLGLIVHGVSPIRALNATAPGQSRAFLRPTGNDSWKPMARAAKRFHEQPEANLYRVFFEDHIKFQYPPSALLIVELFPSPPFDGPDSLNRGSQMNRLLTVASIAALALTVLFSTLIFGKSWQITAGGAVEKASDRMIVVACAVLLGATFYPLLRAHILGQIQVFLDCLIGIALLAYLMGKRGLAGACVGLCCLIKPQYGIVVLWGLLRRDWRFSAWCMSVAAAGLTISMLRFGAANHFEYLKVLRFIALHGEAYWPNQSVNGLLNRLLDNGDALRFDRYSFPPHHTVVYYATLISSVAIVALALWPRRALGHDPVDLSITLLAATLAAPVAWEHHYGILLPIYALAVPVVLRAQPAGRMSALLLIASYLMIANVMLRPAWLLANPWRELGASHLFFGALLLFALLLRTRSLRARPAPA